MEEVAEDKEEEEVLGVEAKAEEDKMGVRMVKVPHEAEDKIEVKEEEEEVVQEDLGLDILDTRPRDMLTNLHLKPATVTGPLDGQLIFVKNQQPAHGKMCGYPSPTNETGTSPELVTNLTSNSYMVCCTIKARKYMTFLLKKMSYLSQVLSSLVQGGVKLIKLIQ